VVELSYDGTFEGLLRILAGVCRGDPPPDRIRRPSPAGEQPDLFGSGAAAGPELAGTETAGAAIAAAEISALAEAFFELSAGAYDSFLCGWMSEFPIEAECIRFGGRVFAGARSEAERAGKGPRSLEARRGAERAAADRGDGAVRTVLSAAYKVRHEVHRLCGFLRFLPGPQGTYIARCSPDHFVLPLLASHFSRRFGDAPWLIIDEKRGLCLHGAGTGDPRLLSPAEQPGQGSPLLRDEAPPNRDSWEDLWRIYHASINNPRRNNPALQRQCIPARYWKYLPELNRIDPPGGPIGAFLARS
jgi:hypothetical protein